MRTGEENRERKKERREKQPKIKKGKVGHHPYQSLKIKQPFYLGCFMYRFECAVILTVLNNYIYFGIVAKPRSSLSVSQKNYNIIIEMFKVKNSKQRSL